MKKKSLNQATLPLTDNKVNTSSYNESFMITPSDITARQNPPAIKQFFNGIYSFNKNYIKNIPATDIIVNKIIKSFFTINPLSNNPGGKKSKLLKRRYKRLSLNRILVGKSEIKHSNDKVSITVYLFNKKKRSLLYKLKQLSTLADENIPYNKDYSLTRDKFSHKLKTSRDVSNKKLKINKEVQSPLTRLKSNKLHNGKNSIIGKKNNNTNSIFKTKNVNYTSSAKLHPGVKTVAKVAHDNMISPVAKPNKLMKISNGFVSVKAHSRLKGNKRISSRVFLYKIYKRYIKNSRTLFNYRNKKSMVKLYGRNSVFSLTPKWMARAFRNFESKRPLALNKRFYSRSNILLNARKRIYTYKTLNILTRRKIHSFFKKLTYKNNAVKYSTYNLGCLPLKRKAIKHYYNSFNKYKLYKFSRKNLKYFINLENHYLKPNTPMLNTSSIYGSLNTRFNRFNSLYISENLNDFSVGTKPLAFALKINKGKKVVAMNKIKLLYKLFTAYNNYSHTHINGIYTENIFKTLPSNIKYKGENSKYLSYYSSKMIWNTYKLLNTPFKPNSYGNVQFKALPINNKLNINRAVQLPAITKANDFKATSNKLNLPTSIYNKKNKKFNAVQLNHLTPLNLNRIEETYVKRFNISVRVKGKEVSFIKINLKKLRSIIKPKGSILSLNNIDLKSIIAISGLKAKILTFKMYEVKKYIIKPLPFETRGKVTSYRNNISRNRNIRRNLILCDELKKIDRFIKKYRKNLRQNINSNKIMDTVEKQSRGATLNQTRINYKSYGNYLSHISNIYKLKYIKELLDREFTYLYYIKMLSFNDTLSKSWFLNPLKNIISKIYNKKIIFNIINLKYIHLNSDILTQAIAIKLRNFKKNRLNKVLKKVLRLVAVSKVNIYACDVNNPIYKYVEQHFNTFKHLNLDIFKDIKQMSFSLAHNNMISPIAKHNISSLPTKVAPLKLSRIRWLDHVQSSTINLMKYKYIFGIRLEASGRLTKRSTASRAVFKIKHKGSLRNNPVISRVNSTSMIKNQMISNIQFAKISSKTRNGSFGLKGWVSNN